MEFIVTFTKDFLPGGKSRPAINEVLGGAGYVGKLEVFGRGRFASIFLDPENLGDLIQKTKGVLVFSECVEAHAFDGNS